MSFWTDRFLRWPPARRKHAALAAAALLLGDQLRSSRCRVYSSDLRVRVLATGLATYPDAAVICGEVQRDPASSTHVTNPSVVVEILSSSTEEYDRDEKREHYQQIESLKEYVLIAQDRRRIEVFARTPSGTWDYSVYTSGDTTLLPSLGAAFAVDELYGGAGVS